MPKTLDRIAEDTSLINRRVEGTTSSLTTLPIRERVAMRSGPFDDSTHRHLFRQVAALNEIECGGEPTRLSAVASVRIAAWNVQRLRWIDSVAEILMRNRC